MTDQDKKKIQEAMEWGKGLKSNFEHVKDIPGIKWANDNLEILLQAAQEMVSGECFASDYREALEKIAERRTTDSMPLIDEDCERECIRLDKRIIELQDIAKKALSSIPRQLATEEEIEKLLPEIVVPKKEWYSMTKEEQRYVQGRNEATFHIRKILLGKIPRQMATREEIIKILKDRSMPSDRAEYLADALVGRVPANRKEK